MTRHFLIAAGRCPCLLLQVHALNDVSAKMEGQSVRECMEMARALHHSIADGNLAATATEDSTVYKKKKHEN